MKRKSLLSLAIVVAAMLVGSQNLFTNTVQPPAGFTGAPGEATCATAGCHAGTAQFNSDFAKLGSLGVNDLTAGLQATKRYDLSVNAVGTSGVSAYGFSVTVLDAAGDSIGNLKEITATTSIATANAKQYVGHQNANSTGAWTFVWESPSTVEPAFFYLVVNRANGNGESSGDAIYKATYRADASGLTVIGATAIQNIDALTDGSISVFPNPVSDRLNLSFDLVTGNNVQAAIYNLNGQMVKPLLDENLAWGTHELSYNVAGELSTGIYLVKMTVDGADYFKKIVVE